MHTKMSIYYRPDDYHPATSNVYGRVSANGGILNGIIQYGQRPSIALYVEEKSHFDHFQHQLLSRLPSASKLLQPIYYGDILSLNKFGLYFCTDPMLTKSAWARSMINPSAYSLCGLTHSFSSISIAEEIGKLIIAPIKAWDAIICTSHAVKKVVQNIFQQWHDYLKQYHQLNQPSSLQLPVIPLGVHVNEISCLQKKPLLRKKFREKWRIKNNDFVVLFYGRLSYYEKSHPVPMYLALENLASRIKNGDAIYFLQAGWFESEEIFKEYKKSLKIFSPSVKSIFLLNLNNADKFEMWSGADVFISLADNIQEAFGLTPLEAMANELPVIVSDWDGYKATVRHGIDGFRIPSILPPAGCGKDLALGYLSGAINYLTYCGLNAQMTAIDIKSCTEALWQLYSSVELRRQMGTSGRQHVIDHFDWKQIIKQYDTLWDELTERRLHAQQENTQLISMPPLLADPFFTFSDLATDTLKSSHLLSLNLFSYKRLEQIQKNNLCHFGWQQRIALPLQFSILDLINQHGPQTVEQIVNYVLKTDSMISSGVIVRSLAYLIKYNILDL
jgi:starch synthase